MTTVRLATADADAERGGWSPGVDDRLANLEEPVRSLLGPDRAALADADRVTIVPDAHYPFHPSSGIVTDPAVVGALVREIGRGTDVAVAGATDERIDFDRTAAYLGYPALLERFDAPLVDLADAPHAGAAGRVDGESVSLSVPERLLEGSVVVVPSLRPTREGPVAGAARLLAGHVHSDGGTPSTAVAAVRAIEPDLALLDATTAYGGEPVATGALAAGSVPAVDGLAADLLGRSIDDDDVLAALLDTGDGIDVETVGGADLEAIRARVPHGDLPPSTEVHPAVSAAYRLYAAVGGDAVPPQLER